MASSIADAMQNWARVLEEVVSCQRDQAAIVKFHRARPDPPTPAVKRQHERRGRTGKSATDDHDIVIELHR